MILVMVMLIVIVKSQQRALQQLGVEAQDPRELLSMCSKVHIHIKRDKLTANVFNDTITLTH